MRSRLGGCAVALALLLGACGSDKGSADADRPRDAEPLLAVNLASVRDTLPPAPASTAPASVTVVLSHPAGADDPGLDAAAAALAQRPDLRVEVVTGAGPGARDGIASTMSGFPVTALPGAASEAVAATLSGSAGPADLVIVGIGRGHGIGRHEPIAEAAVALGVPAVVVGVEDGEVVDYAAAAMQLLDVLDFELDELLADPAAVHRLAVPSCRTGTLRGRVPADPSTSVDAALGSDCASAAGRDAPVGSEADAFAAGWATLTRLR